ncbi:ABC transporter ATP-binding protein [Pedobacter aquatilis]|uniref:ABC transporter ATP-binding protein n=1 Tax=Pedobacter aquatilis TaxID=351343 RepID=UPI00292E96B3|nr:ATP-binding cassette domain-containing protein [Pedobacter aquatilis]
MIILESLTKSYGAQKALDEVSLEVNEGETLILLGTSGCGKTTTLKMINRLLSPDEGKVSIQGRDIKNEDTVTLRRGIGYVMQHIGLFPHYTVAENIAVVPGLLGWKKSKIDSRIKELMDTLHLPVSYLKLYPAALSGGQQQRVGLARALAADPKILLMDEPFGALDNVTRAGIQLEFKALESLKQKTVVMVTHDVQEAFELADRICLMDKGKVMQIGKPEDLLFKPENEFTRKFFDDQRLALELKAIKISNIMEHSAKQEELHLPGLSANMSIWAAMEKLQATSIGNGDVGRDISEENTSDFKNLMTAFYNYKKHISNE